MIYQWHHFRALPFFNSGCFAQMVSCMNKESLMIKSQPQIVWTSKTNETFLVHTGKQTRLSQCYWALAFGLPSYYDHQSYCTENISCSTRQVFKKCTKRQTTDKEHLEKKKYIYIENETTQHTPPRVRPYPLPLQKLVSPTALSICTRLWTGTLFPIIPMFNTTRVNSFLKYKHLKRISMHPNESVGFLWYL